MVGSVAVHTPQPKGVQKRPAVVAAAAAPVAAPVASTSSSAASEFPSTVVKNEALHPENPPAVSYHSSIVVLNDKDKQPVNSAIRVGNGLLTTKHAASQYAFAGDYAFPASYRSFALANDLVFLLTFPPNVDSIPTKHFREPKLGEVVCVNDKLNGKSSQATVSQIIKDGNDLSCLYNASTQAGTCGTPVVALSDGAVVGIHNADGRFLGISPYVLKFFRDPGATVRVRVPTESSKVLSRVTKRQESRPVRRARGSHSAKGGRGRGVASAKN